MSQPLGGFHNQGGPRMTLVRCPRCLPLEFIGRTCLGSMDVHIELILMVYFLCDIVAIQSRDFTRFLMRAYFLPLENVIKAHLVWVHLIRVGYTRAMQTILDGPCFAARTSV